MVDLFEAISYLSTTYYLLPKYGRAELLQVEAFDLGPSSQLWGGKNQTQFFPRGN